MLSPEKSVLVLSIGFLSIVAVNYVYLFLYKSVNDYKRLNELVMGMVLIIFGALKLVDLHKFASIFNRYDVISRHVPGYLYPFIEMALGISFLKRCELDRAYMATIALMVVSILSVIIGINSGQQLRCGCLESFFHIPLSYVTLTENIAMLGMGASHFTNNKKS